MTELLAEVEVVPEPLRIVPDLPRRHPAPAGRFKKGIPEPRGQRFHVRPPVAYHHNPQDRPLAREKLPSSLLPRQSLSFTITTYVEIAGSGPITCSVRHNRTISMIYAFIDTNVFVRVLSQGKPGCEPQRFLDLQSLVAGNAFRLLVPDIVRFELDRQMRDLPEGLKKRFGELKANVNQTAVWSEIADAKEAIMQQIESLRREKEADWLQRFSDVDKFLRSDSVIRLEYTPEIMCKARIRIMRGGRPTKDQDAAIVESLASFFATCSDDSPVLLFCSENHSDFAVELAAAPDRSRRFAVDPEIAGVLPQTHYFLRLDGLLEMDRGYESLPTPPEDAEIVQAKSRLAALEDKGLDHTDEYLTVLADVEALYDQRLSQEFMSSVHPQIPEELRVKREAACAHIQEMLHECRECESWDDVRSECKLPQWMENVPEHMLPFTSLARLLRIEESIGRYLLIHEEMDDDLGDR